MSSQDVEGIGRVASEVTEHDKEFTGKRLQRDEESIVRRNGVLLHIARRNSRLGAFGGWISLICNIPKCHF